MNITNTIKQKAILEEYEGRSQVLAKVIWEIEFSEEGYISTHQIVTVINQNTLAEKYKVPVHRLTDNDIFNLCTEQEGGQEWFRHVYESHRQAIAGQKFDDSLTIYDE